MGSAESLPKRGRGRRETRVSLGEKGSTHAAGFEDRGRGPKASSQQPPEAGKDKGTD